MKNRHCPAFRFCREDCGDCAHIIKYNKLYKEINRKKAEIDMWKKEVNHYQNLWCKAEADAQEARSKAIKEFAGRLKVQCFLPFGTYIAVRICTEKEIDNLVKEMTEGEK